MLNRLYVRNYALINELELNFDNGLTIITGETGAGKSILLGALGLILGNRADSSTLLEKSEKCIVEGSFTLREMFMKSFFDENDLDYSEIIVLRREIAVSGRSRAFINDTPVNLDLMRELGYHLIDIHSQHQTLMLGENTFQLAIVDSFVGHNGLLDNYLNTYNEYRVVEKEYKMLSERVDRDRADFDYFNHQLTQLDEAKLQPGEETDLEIERDQLMNAGEIHDALKSSSTIISSDEYSVVPRLNEIKRLLEKIENFLPESTSYLERFSSTIIELNDLSNEIEKRSGSIEADPGRLDTIISRLDTIFTLLQRHRSESVEELVEIREELRKKVNDISVSDERIAELKLKFEQLEQLLNGLGKEISENRMEIIPDVESQMEELLLTLGMPNGRFKVSMSKLTTYSMSGIDHADFMFTANRQSAPENLGKVASGGELSRVMLSLKSLLTDNKDLPTIFFDEIDAGVSGEVATRVGQILTGMGQRMQVINITHLPQVAAHATAHYFVFKEDEGDSTITRIRLLDKEERVNEVARLLSGDKITKASLDNAKELINRT